MQQYKYIKNEIEIFQKFLAKYGGKVVPCTSQEVKALESLIPKQCHIPEAYQEFLLYGGKGMAGLFNEYEAGYEAVKKRLLTQNQRITRMVQFEDIPEKKELPADLFVIEEVSHCGNFTYLLLTEGDNPPIYFWEEGEGGLEHSRKLADSFSDYLMKEIKIKAMYSASKFIGRKIKAGELPREQQFWIPEESEYLQGIKEEKLMKRLGFGGTKFYEVTKSNPIDPYSYLEELSGWKARKVGDEVRFFPPSYKSPEEKDRKVLEQQNQLEEQKQELAKVEKIIANLQDRIKNLSGGKLTGGINFKNTSASRIKELEKELRKQKIVKQKIEKEIVNLEDNMN